MPQYFQMQWVNGYLNIKASLVFMDVMYISHALLKCQLPTLGSFFCYSKGKKKEKNKTHYIIIGRCFLFTPILECFKILCKA